jgi:polar amino acid transport system permease protein
MTDKILLFFLRLLPGVLVTLYLTVCGIGLGFALGLSLALAKIYGGKAGLIISTVYGRIFRSIPLLVLIFLFFFAILPRRMENGDFLAVILALGLRSAAFQSQIFFGAIEAISSGQMVAGMAVGMSKLQVLRYIILPQAFTLAIPSWATEFAVVIKDTSFGFIIGISDIMGIGELLRGGAEAAGSSQHLPIFLLVAVIYLAMTFPVTKILGYWGSKKKKMMGYR